MISVAVSDRAYVFGAADDVVSEIRVAFTHVNPKRKAMEAQGIRGFWAEPKEIATWREEPPSGISIPRGGLRKVREILKARSLVFRIEDRRCVGEALDVEGTSVELWPHQRRVVDAGIVRQNCLVKSGTASGKTTALLALVGELKVSTLVVVHSTKLMTQWAERAVDELGMHPSEVGQLGDGKRRVRGLTIGTQKSVIAEMGRDPKFRERWGMVIADEVHLFAAKSFFASVDPFPAKYRIGASDDHRRKDRKDFLIHDLFGEVAEEVSDRELIDGGHVMQAEVMVIPTDFEAPWYGIPEDENDDRSPDFDRLLGAMQRDEARELLVRTVIAGEALDGRLVLAMSDRREHCVQLGSFAATIAPAGYLVGGADYKVAFEKTRRGMKTGKVRVGVGTFQACGTGTDIPGVEVVVCASPILSNKSKFRQARGRAMRKPKGKTVARMYVFWDRHVFGERHLANAASWNELTYVRDGEAWVPAKEYLKRLRKARREQA